MNPSPRLNWNGIVRNLDNPGCGRMAMQNTERAFWQSRALLRDPPELTDLPMLAKNIRMSYALPV